MQRDCNKKGLQQKKQATHLKYQHRDCNNKTATETATTRPQQTGTATDRDCNRGIQGLQQKEQAIHLIRQQTNTICTRSHTFLYIRIHICIYVYMCIYACTFVLYICIFSPDTPTDQHSLQKITHFPIYTYSYIYLYVYMCIYT